MSNAEQPTVVVLRFGACARGQCCFVKQYIISRNITQESYNVQ